MLSLSADLSNTSVNIQMINGDQDAAIGGVDHAAELMAFAESIARRDDEVTLASYRSSLEHVAGASVVVDAAAVA